MGGCPFRDPASFQRAFWLGDADFVMPKSGDDMLAPDFIESLMGVLEAHPDIGEWYRVRGGDLLEVVAADAASPETRRTVERAESRQQALALLLMSPEFQRR